MRPPHFGEPVASPEEMTMRQFIVAVEPYTPFGPGAEPIDVRLVEAEDLNALAEKLEPGIGDESDLSPWEALMEANGDGMAGYTVRELVGKHLVDPEEVERAEAAEDV
jgi:hypothetical protein